MLPDNDNEVFTIQTIPLSEIKMTDEQREAIKKLVGLDHLPPIEIVEEEQEQESHEDHALFLD